MSSLERLTVLRLERAPIATLPSELFTRTRVAALELRGTRITKAAFLELDGVDEFLKRREASLSRSVAGGVIVDGALCGLD